MNNRVQDGLLSAVEKSILRLFEEDARERQLPEIVAFIGRTGVDEVTVKAAVLRLHSRGHLLLTPDWTLKTVAG